MTDIAGQHGEPRLSQDFRAVPGHNGKKPGSGKRALQALENPQSLPFTRLCITKCFPGGWKMLRPSGIWIQAIPLPKRAITRRSEEHTSELQSLMRTPYAVFCLKKKKNTNKKDRKVTNKKKIRNKLLYIQNMIYITK